jgi:hypothetical protein
MSLREATGGSGVENYFAGSGSQALLPTPPAHISSVQHCPQFSAHGSVRINIELPSVCITNCGISYNRPQTTNNGG